MRVWAGREHPRPLGQSLAALRRWRRCQDPVLPKCTRACCPPLTRPLPSHREHYGMRVVHLNSFFFLSECFMIVFLHSVDFIYLFFCFNCSFFGGSYLGCLPNFLLYSHCNASFWQCLWKRYTIQTKLNWIELTWERLILKATVSVQVNRVSA